MVKAVRGIYFGFQQSGPPIPVAAMMAQNNNETLLQKSSLNSYHHTMQTVITD
jgi:hypothetical protein